MRHPRRRIPDIKAANDTHVFAGRVVSGADGSRCGHTHDVLSGTGGKTNPARALFYLFCCRFRGEEKSQAGHHLACVRFKNNTAQSVQDPTLPPPTTPGAHAADPVAIETATDFSRAGVLGKGSRDIQYKWDRQDDDGPPSAAPPRTGLPSAGRTRPLALPLARQAPLLVE